MARTTEDEDVIEINSEEEEDEAPDIQMTSEVDGNPGSDENNVINDIEDEDEDSAQKENHIANNAKEDEEDDEVIEIFEDGEDDVVAGDDDGEGLELKEEEGEDDDDIVETIQNGSVDDSEKIEEEEDEKSGGDTSAAQPLEDDEEDDVIEIFEADPLGGGEEGDTLGDEEEKMDESELSSLNNSNSESDTDKKGGQSTIVINDTKSLANLSNSGPTNGSSTTKEAPARKEPTLVIIDTNSILSGRGPMPMKSSSPLLSSQINRSSPHNHNSYGGDIGGMVRQSGPVKIPDDAFLIEAPSFIVPYVFEQNGKTSMKTTIKELGETVKKENKEKAEAAGEPYIDTPLLPERKKTEDYFESPVGKLLMNVGMNLVQEYVQVDLLKMQKRKAEKEKAKSRGFVPMQTQQSIISLKNNIEESKENNEPFRHRMKKCELCNFKTESALVMSTHLETPHMRNYSYRCNFCPFTTREPHAILYHMESEHSVKPRLERAPAYHQCPNCPFEDNSKAKLTRHLLGCVKRFKIEKNLEPPTDWDTPAKLPKLPKSRMLPQGGMGQQYMSAATANQQNRTIIAYSNMANKYIQQQHQQQQAKMNLPPLLQAPKKTVVPGLIRSQPKVMSSQLPSQLQRAGMLMRNPVQMAGQIISQSHLQLANNQILQQVISGQLDARTTSSSSGNSGGFLSKLGRPVSNNKSLGTGISFQNSASSSSQSMRNMKSSSQPSISITPLPRQTQASTPSGVAQAKPQAKTSFVICEICDGYIKDLDQLRNHMQWIHKVKIHPKMIYNKPPLNCQKCQFRFFTDQGLERHLLGSHGLVTSSMQDAANKGQDNGRCPLCGKVYQWKLLSHVAKDHNVTLKPAHLSYKCTVCTATFGMYKLFESHVYSAHSMNSKKNERRPQSMNQGNNMRGSQMQVTSRPISSSTQNSFRPMKINDEITIIPQPMANNSPLRSKGSLTITPQSSTRRNVRSNEDEGIQIIEIDDAPQKGSSNGRNPKENGEFLGRLPISDSILRKRNLEISVCGTDSDNNSSADESFQPQVKRIRQN